MHACSENKSWLEISSGGAYGARKTPCVRLMPLDRMAIPSQGSPTSPAARSSNCLCVQQPSYLQAQWNFDRPIRFYTGEPMKKGQLQLPTQPHKSPHVCRRISTGTE
jgi:hypothetical protein